MGLADPDGEDYHACGGGSCSENSNADFASWANDLIGQNYRFFGTAIAGLITTKDGVYYGAWAWKPIISIQVGAAKELGQQALFYAANNPNPFVSSGLSEEQLARAEKALETKENMEAAGQWAAAIVVGAVTGGGSRAGMVASRARGVVYQALNAAGVVEHVGIADNFKRRLAQRAHRFQLPRFLA